MFQCWWCGNIEQRPQKFGEFPRSLPIPTIPCCNVSPDVLLVINIKQDPVILKDFLCSANSIIMSLTALESAFAFYASYHSNKTNQLIHIFCVWPILFTAQIFLAYTPSVLPAYPIINGSLIVSVFYMMYYFIIEQPGIAGPIASALVLGGYLFATSIHESTPDIWKLALFIHVACWAAQIYGHQAHEGRSPAFLDNMAQALLFAPLFVLLEVMFHFGYKPDFQKKATALASKNIAEFRHSRAEAVRQKKQ